MLFIYAGSNPAMSAAILLAMAVGFSTIDALFIGVFVMAGHLLWKWRGEIRQFGISEAAQRYMDGISPGGTYADEGERMHHGENRAAHEQPRAATEPQSFFPSLLARFTSFLQPEVRHFGNEPRARRARASPTNYAATVQRVSQYPIEAWVDPADLPRKPIRYLRAMAERRGLSTTGIFEKSELVDLLSSAGGSSGQSCAICAEDYQDGDSLRVLPGCRHAFHVRCIDRWAFQERSGAPKCPMCQSPMT
jgi:hypothetical protein